MAYAMGSYSGGTSSAPPASIQLPPLDTLHPGEWISSVWNAYVELWPKILGLQHEAATIAATTGPGVVHDTARAVVSGAAELMRIQTRVQASVEKYRAELGLGAVVSSTLAVIFAGIALVILWSFRRYDALSATLDAVNAQTLTPEQAQGLLHAAGPMPDLSAIGGIGLGAILGIAAVVGFLYFASQRRHSNPELFLLGANPQPEGVWSRRVLSLDYIHDDDGQAYTHTFRPGVNMQALEDGSVRLYNGRRRIWKDF